jgi:hypothetical protein
MLGFGRRVMAYAIFVNEFDWWIDSYFMDRFVPAGRTPLLKLWIHTEPRASRISDVRLYLDGIHVRTPQSRIECQKSSPYRSRSEVRVLLHKWIRLTVEAIRWIVRISYNCIVSCPHTKLQEVQYVLIKN